MESRIIAGHAQIRRKKKLLPALALFALSGLSIFPNLANAKRPSDWVVDKFHKIDDSHEWRSSILYADDRKIKPIVCSLDYKVSLPDKPVAHPFVFLVSRISHEFWTSDRAWTLSPGREGLVKLEIGSYGHVFEMNPETDHIFMTLIEPDEMDKILKAMDTAKTKAVLTLHAKKSKTVPLPLESLPLVIESFKSCMATRSISASVNKPLTKPDVILPKEFEKRDKEPS